MLTNTLLLWQLQLFRWGFPQGLGVFFIFDSFSGSFCVRSDTDVGPESLVCKGVLLIWGQDFVLTSHTELPLYIFVVFCCRVMSEQEGTTKLGAWNRPEVGSYWPLCTTASCKHALGFDPTCHFVTESLWFRIRKTVKNYKVVNNGLRFIMYKWRLYEVCIHLHFSTTWQLFWTQTCIFCILALIQSSSFGVTLPPATSAGDEYSCSLFYSSGQI